MDVEAWTEVHLLRVFERRAVMRAVDELSHQAELETRNRKPLRHPIAELPDATWEVRVPPRYHQGGRYDREDLGETAMSRPFTVTRAEARELKRRSESVRRGGGIPHEVVRREWLAEMERELRMVKWLQDEMTKPTIHGGKIEIPLTYA